MIGEYCRAGDVWFAEFARVEREADRIGVELAARGCYDPSAAITLWQKMAQAGGSGGPAFLSTHPAAADRITDLQK